MDNILELIFTLIFGFFWLFGGSFFKKRESDEPNPAAQEKGAASDDDARQQDIPEANRRKIAEGNQQGRFEPVVVAEQTPSLQYPQTLSQLFGEQDEGAEPAFQAESAAMEANRGTFLFNTGESTYEQAIQERLQEIETTKREAETIKGKVKEGTNVRKEHHSRKDMDEEATLFAGSIRSALKNPQNARVAFICGEILGKPTGLQNLPGGF